MFLRPGIDYNLDPMINLQSEFNPISYARNNFSRLIDFIDIPFNFDGKPKDLELGRFEAQFYGYYYDRKRANYVLGASVGLKRNYGLFMPLFYYSPKRLNYNKRFKSINDDSGFFYYFLFKNSFGYEGKDLSILERYYAHKVRWNDYESRENSLLSLSATTARLQYPKNKFKGFVEEKRFEIDHSISVYDYEWRKKNFDLTSTSLSIARMSIRDLINPSFLSTSVYINDYENRKVNSPDTYFAYKRTIHFLSQCFSPNSIIFKSRVSSFDHNGLYSKYRFMLLKSYSLLFKSNFDKFTRESRTRFSNTKYLLYRYFRSIVYRDFYKEYLYPVIAKNLQFDMKLFIKSFKRVESARRRLSRNLRGFSNLYGWNHSPYSRMVLKRIQRAYMRVLSRESKRLFSYSIYNNNNICNKYRSSSVYYDCFLKYANLIYEKIFREIYYEKIPLNYIKYFIYSKKLLNVFSTYTIFAGKSDPLGYGIKSYHNLVKGGSDDTSNGNRLGKKIFLNMSDSSSPELINFRMILSRCVYEPLKKRFDSILHTKVVWSRYRSRYLELCNYVAYAFRNASEDSIQKNTVFGFNAYQQEKFVIDKEKLTLLEETLAASYGKRTYTDFYKNFHLRSGIAFRMYITKVNDLKAFVFFRLSPNLPLYSQNNYELKGFLRKTSYMNGSSTFLYCKSGNKLQQYLPFLNNIGDNLFFFIKLKLSNCQIHSYTYSHFIRLIINYFMNLKNVLGSNETDDALNPNALDYCIYNSRKRYSLNISGNIWNFVLPLEQAYTYTNHDNPCNYIPLGGDSDNSDNPDNLGRIWNSVIPDSDNSNDFDDDPDNSDDSDDDPDNSDNSDNSDDSEILD